MGDNALSEVAWIHRQDGRATVRDTLLNAHKPDCKLDLSLPGFAVSSQLRILTHVLAVTFRHLEHTSGEARYKQVIHILENGIPAGAVDGAIADLDAGAHLFNPVHPFLQRPPLPEQKKNDTGRRIGPNNDPVTKLLPSKLSEEGKDFWNLGFAGTGRLPLHEAVLHIAVFYCFYPAENTRYDGDKCEMGAPGFRFVGKDNTATEVVWWGETLLETLFYMTPSSWVAGAGLPAWADRTGTQSQEDNDMHPLWKASWSSNSAVCCWEEGELAGVRRGGVPSNWLPRGVAKGTGKEAKDSRKAWWDLRNLSDPFYLYRDGKMVRVDFGRDATQLAVEWAANLNISLAREHARTSILIPGSTLLASDPRLMFIRHQIGGEPGSLSIRASSVFMPDDSVWSFNLGEEFVEAVADEAKFIQSLLKFVVAPFRRSGVGDRQAAAKNQVPNVLDPLKNQRADAASAFWRSIHDVYADLIAATQDGLEIPPEVYWRGRDAALAAFDFVTTPHIGQYPAQISHSRSRLDSLLRGLVNQRISPVNASEGDDDE
ncbi:CRISPR-associated protein Cse1 [Trueperella bernardiae]|uniref:CRISPR-associated protein Cse1 n=1 Tax=Trueperella bernardiae TaxID=59561 RepID=A0A0W1KKV0_9ACTO|nr:type I-E CRISPR-associated protein Cse1/CasA [Trueperella bernardiae]KTF04578.1 CRISPR-associated protein Cse1 [Trueperella bernardiae]